MGTPAQTPLELSKTIKINEKDYNINAVNADTADKVANKLILTPVEPISSTNTQDSISFDGNEELEFEVMTAAGGEFTGNITVPSILGESSEPTNRQTVLNFEDISTKVLSDLKNNSTVYAFSESDGLQAMHDSSLVTGTSANKINGISVVLGAADDLYSFAEQNDTLSSYFYICNASSENIPLGSIFFGIGTGSSDEEDTIIFISKTAIEIGPEYSYKDLHDELDSYADNINYIASNVFGTDFSGEDTEYDAFSILGRLDEAEGRIETIDSNLSGVAVQAATLETELDNLTNSHDSLNEQVEAITNSGFYRPSTSSSVGESDNKITISTAQPSNPKTNDIWIKIS